MKMKDWKKCMCLMGISLFMASNLCASQIGNVEGSNTPVKKTRSTTFIVEKVHGNLQEQV